jgi:hypothetical protein
METLTATSRRRAHLAKHQKPDRKPRRTGRLRAGTDIHRTNTATERHAETEEACQKGRFEALEGSAQGRKAFAVQRISFTNNHEESFVLDPTPTSAPATLEATNTDTIQTSQTEKVSLAAKIEPVSPIAMVAHSGLGSLVFESSSSVAASDAARADRHPKECSGEQSGLSITQAVGSNQPTYFTEIGERVASKAPPMSFKQEPGPANTSIPLRAQFLHRTHEIIWIRHSNAMQRYFAGKGLPKVVWSTKMAIQEKGFRNQAQNEVQVAEAKHITEEQVGNGAQACIADFGGTAVDAQFPDDALWELSSTELWRYYEDGRSWDQLGS